MFRSSGLYRSASLTVGVFGLTSTLAMTVAYAQSATGSASSGALEEIVVTAEHRAEDVQKTGASVSVRNGDDLLAQGKFRLESILEDIPGVTGGAANATGGTGGGGTDTPASGLVIRGIPSNTGAGGSTTATAPAAAIYVDGVYNGVGGSYDLERVEMLRGPQGTLYGRSATAGLVAIHTRDPKLDAFGGNATLEAGNYSLQHYAAALNLPILNDVLGMRVSGNYYARDGYIDAEGGAFHSTDGRIKVLYKPNEDFSLLVGAALNDSVDHSGGIVIGVSQYPTVVNYADVGSIESVDAKSRQYWAEVNWNIGIGTLTYLPAYRSWNNDGTLLVYGVNGILTQPLSTPKDDFVTHELRLASDPDSKLNWQLGALYYENELSSTNSAFFGPAKFYQDDVISKKTTAYGLFAEATYPFADAWRVTAGVRYDDTKISVHEFYQAGAPLGGGSYELSGDAGERQFSNTTYKLRLEHDLTPANLLYALVSTGFSPGDVTVAQESTPQGTILQALELEAETLTSYEIGSKNRFLDDKLQVNAAAFYMKYGAYQSAGINTNPNGFPPIFATLSSPLESYGLEFELSFKPTVADLLNFNVGWTQAKFVDKPAQFAMWVANDEVSSSSGPGSRAPIPLTMLLGYDHIFMLPGDSTLTLHGDVRYLSGHSGYFTEATKAVEPYVRIESAVLGNLNATWAATKNISLTGYVRNVADHQYITKNTYSSGVYQQVLNDPRTYGAVLNVNF